MKKALLFMALMLSVSLTWAQSSYDFSAVSPSGHTLYYTIVDGDAVVTCEIAAYPYYSSHPTGALVIPTSVAYSGTTYSVTAIGDYAFAYCEGLTNITIPNSVTLISNHAFFFCRHLASLTIPNSVTTIGNSAFGYCERLTSVTIPNSVTSVSGYAFNSCNSLTSLTVDPGNTHYDSRDNCNAIIETSTNTLVAGCPNTTIPNSVTSIGVGAFADCSALTSITIPNSVTSIGNYAFYYCDALTSITIPNSVTSIGVSAFEDCSSLESVSLGNSVTTIDMYAFEECNSLTSITIPSSVTSIGNLAFSYCMHLKTIYNLSALPITKGASSYGGVAYYANRVIDGNVFIKYGSGMNALYQIFNPYYNIVANETGVETDIPESTIPDNFIYLGSDYTWKAKRVVLTDCQDDFYAPLDFTADNATFTRSFKEQYRSTLCLPFTTAKPESLEVYEFADFSDRNISFSPVDDDTIHAYTPYLVGYDLSKAAGDPVECTFAEVDAFFPATPMPIFSSTINDMTFYGTMERTQMPTNCYGYKDGLFVQSGGSAHVNPFRCYLSYSGSLMMPASLSVSVTEGAPLAIDAVDTTAESHIRYSNDVYDMMGRIVRKNADSLQGLPQGIYFWRGKKLMAY